MNEKVESIVLEQLRLIREDMKNGFERVESRFEDLEVKVDGHTAMLVAFGKYIHDIDERVEHIEQKLGIET